MRHEKRKKIVSDLTKTLAQLKRDIAEKPQSLSASELTGLR
jgi:hypothetical protein